MNHHDRYIDSAVKAWRSVTESYAQIFTALAAASAPEPSEGKPMREGHESFLSMAGMAAEANSMAESFVLYEEQQNGHSERADQNDDEQDSESASNAPLDSNTRGHVQNSSAGAITAQSLQMEARSKEAMRKKRVEEMREKHKKERLALRARKKSEVARVGAKHSAPAKEDAASVPGAPYVEYEDVSAEVEARLKAKQARKEAAKKEKKRKRDSGESLGVDVPEEEVVQKPAKKRSRSDSVQGDVEMVAAKEKRKKDGRAGDDGDGGRRSKKAKTKG
jgi:hypothetical protein